MSENIESVDLSHLEEDNEDYEHHVDSNRAVIVPQMPQMTLCTFAGFWAFLGGRGADCESKCTAAVMAIALNWQEYSSVLNAECRP